MENDMIINDSETTTPKTKSFVFMKKQNFYKLFWVYIIGCVIGVVVEVIFCILKYGRYESRVGLVWGPFNPVYGFGAVVMLIVLSRLAQKRDLWIFLGSMVIGGLFEYFCSLFQELTFGTVSWEYSDTQINIAGRTNLLYSFFWGILGLVFIKDIMPRLNKLLEKLKGKTAFIITWIMIVFMAVDMAVSSMAVYRWQRRDSGIASTNVLTQCIDKFFPDEFMEKEYPNMIRVKK
ncbi:MAG: putative ABC transporter permease [Oscillospiraceae bacterium]